MGKALKTDYRVSQADLFEFLSSLKTLPTRGSFLYSNLGFGLLGYLMELRCAGTDVFFAPFHRTTKKQRIFTNTGSGQA
jgi:hypothetical protein